MTWCSPQVPPASLAVPSLASPLDLHMSGSPEGSLLHLLPFSMVGPYPYPWVGTTHTMLSLPHTSDSCTQPSTHIFLWVLQSIWNCNIAETKILILSLQNVLSESLIWKLTNTKEESSQKWGRRAKWGQGNVPSRRKFILINDPV